jgi:uncharacterized damage-inducible protein DinB
MVTQGTLSGRIPVVPLANPRLFHLLRHLHVSRGHTLRLVDNIPAECIERPPVHGLPAFADVARHLAATSRWVFVEIALGNPAAYKGHGRDLCVGHEGVLAYLESTHADSLALLRSLTEDSLDETVHTPDEADIPRWRWLQLMADHEAHYRGQLALMMKMIGVRAPTIAPTYGPL